ncbi:MAG: hypothetical protein M1816_002201 [Peltula sp. TS41687]|nr:MAG: hypothetical protein M1816_002201 [Peltula sp. TS41687]
MRFLNAFMLSRLTVVTVLAAPCEQRQSDEVCPVTINGQVTLILLPLWKSKVSSTSNIERQEGTTTTNLTETTLAESVHLLNPTKTGLTSMESALSSKAPIPFRSTSNEASTTTSTSPSPTRLPFQSRNEEARGSTSLLTRSGNQQATTENEPIPVMITSVAGLSTTLSSNSAWTSNTVVTLTESDGQLTIIPVLVGCGPRCGGSTRGAGLLLGNLPINRPGIGPPTIFKFPGLPSFSRGPDGAPDSLADKERHTPSDQKPTETRSSDSTHSSSSSTTSTSTSTSAIETGYVILAWPGTDTSAIDKAIKAKVNDPQNVDAFIPDFREVRAMWTTGGGLNQSQVKELSNLPGVEGIFPNEPISMKSDPAPRGFVTPMPSASRSNECTAMTQIFNQVQPSKIAQDATGTLQNELLKRLPWK